MKALIRLAVVVVCAASLWLEAPRLEFELRTFRSDLVTINVTHTGFTAEAQAAFQYAVDIWQSQLTSTVPVRVNAEFTVLDPGFLGSVGRTTIVIREPSSGCCGISTWRRRGAASRVTRFQWSYQSL